MQGVIIEGETLTLGAAHWRIESVGGLTTGGDGGWAALVSARIVGDIGPFEDLIVGQSAGATGTEPEILRSLETLSGITQLSFHHVSMGGGSIAYTSYPQSVWVDDQLILRPGDPVAGSNGWTWGSFSAVHLGANGRLIVKGEAREPTTGNSYFVVCDVTSGAVLMDGFHFYPGIPRRLTDSSIPIVLSPNGEHWATTVVQNHSGATALLADGAVYESEPGYPVTGGAPLPPAIRDAAGPGQWENTYDAPLIDDDGAVSFASRAIVNGLHDRHLIVRDGRLFFYSTMGSKRVHALHDRGGLVWQHWEQELVAVERIRSEGATLVEDRAGIDLDGDGAADPLFLLHQRQGFGGRDEASAGLFQATMRWWPSTMTFTAILRALPHRMDQVICEGVSNSTGAAAELMGVGSQEVWRNEVSLEVFDLPTLSSGYCLLSKNTGVAVQPPGSSGLLCLGGAIGRHVAELFHAGPEGRASVVMDLTRVPQPMGAVPALAGQTWYAQAWYRDAVNGMATSNFSNAISIAFL